MTAKKIIWKTGVDEVPANWVSHELITSQEDAIGFIVAGIAIWENKIDANTTLKTRGPIDVVLAT